MPDYSWARRDDWEAAWQPLVDLVGQDLRPGDVSTAVDRIEPALVRHYLEPLEFDCPLHVDDEAARAHGYPGMIAPYSGLATWVSAGVWAPGDDPVYLTDRRDDQPRFRGRRTARPGPDVNAMFATDVDSEFHRPFVVGDRLALRGRRLLSVEPKQTRVGRGAFLWYEYDVVDEAGDPVATWRICMYEYVAAEGSG